MCFAALNITMLYRADTTREKKSWLMRLEHVLAIVRWVRSSACSSTCLVCTSCLCACAAVTYHCHLPSNAFQFLQLDDFERIRTLGVGGAGIVYEILHKHNGSRFALKEMEVGLSLVDTTECLY